jgi:thioredoxin 1
MKKNIIIILLLTIAVVAVVGIKKNNQKDTNSSSCVGGICSLPTGQENILQTNTVAETTDVKKTLPKLLDLGASKCVPCKMMTPILDEMKETFSDQLEVVFVDVWKDQSAGQAYEIRMIPTQIFFDDDGKELFRHEGFYSREDIISKWQEFGIVLEDKAQNQK